MNMVYVSMCLCLPEFLCSVLWSFLRTGVLPPRIGLFLGTLFFLFYQMGLFFLISGSDISLMVYKNFFDYLILTLYPAVLRNSFIR